MQSMETRSLCLSTVCLIASIPIAAISYLRLKTPEFDDNFAVRDETKLVLYSICGGFVAVALLSLVYHMVWSMAWSIVWSIGFLLAWATVYFLVTVWSTLYVVHRNKQWLSMTANRAPKDIVSLMRQSTSQKPSTPGSPNSTSIDAHSPRGATLAQVRPSAFAFGFRVLL